MPGHSVSPGERVASHRWSDSLGLREFLARYPEFARRPDKNGGVRLVGCLERRFTADGLPALEERFELELVVSRRFPRIPPSVFETAGRIPPSYHKLDNDSLCLASRLRLALALRTAPSLLAFFDDLVVSYLYRYAYREKYKEDPWPDIDHGPSALLDDYVKLLGLPTHELCLGYMKLLGLKKRVANKKPCPCGSGTRTGRCHNMRLNALRERFKMVPRGQFHREHQMLKFALAEEGGADEALPRVEASNGPRIASMSRDGEERTPARCSV